MQIDTIKEIGVNANGALWIKPAAATFPYIYREAVGVHWDSERLYLYSPRPRELSYAAWFIQITDAASAQGITLKLDSATLWSNVSDDIKQTIIAVAEFR
jgi:hypothetical protein